MDNAFWLERWRQGQIGFHQAEVNAYLQGHWERLDVRPPSTVFIPLCGKSLDMLWLSEQGYQVIGVEVSEQACRDFFAENNMAFELIATEHFLLFNAKNIHLYCGDFFDMTAQDLADVAAVYDRAAMVAMPPSRRAEYVNHLRAIMPRQASLFLVTMEYRQEQMDGPPFAVLSDEVMLSYADAYRIETVLREDVLADNARFLERGVTELVEAAYIIKPL